MNALRRDTSSFRDPCGYVFHDSTGLGRAIRKTYWDTWRDLHTSGCLDHLHASQMLVGHNEESAPKIVEGEEIIIIRPHQIPFISYPYEWCPSQLCDAGIQTIRVMREALSYGFVLKDASAYNIQFHGCRPILIDTLSLSRYVDGTPWVGYGQFCRHFIAPLAIAKQVGPGVFQQLKSHLDGIPLETCAKTMPLSSWLHPGILIHVHLQARFGRHATLAKRESRPAALPKQALLQNLDHLEKTLESFRPKEETSHWRRYYDTQTHYSRDDTRQKIAITDEVIRFTRPRMVWDIGCNTGRFTDIAVAHGCTTIAMDSDYTCIEFAYNKARKESGKSALSLLQDATNPSPSLGWAGIERKSLAARGPADLILALGLIHHLRITHQIRFEMLATWMAEIGKSVLIEWIPITDPMASHMAKRIDGDFHDFTIDTFLANFSKFFSLERRATIGDTGRQMLHFTRKAES